VKTEELMIAGLKEDIESINKAIRVLSRSLEKCTKIPVKTNYTADISLYSFSFVTSRFHQSGF
jgi:hypothetical protein